MEILRALSKTLSLSNDIDFHKVASHCEHFTGADLKAVLYNAQLLVAHDFLKGKNTSEKYNKGGALNGIIQENKLWCSSNVTMTKEKEEEITHGVNTINFSFL